MKQFDASIAQQIILGGKAFDTEWFEIIEAPDWGAHEPWVIAASDLAEIFGKPSASAGELAAACKGYVVNETKDGAMFMFDKATLQALLRTGGDVSLQRQGIEGEEYSKLLRACLFQDGEGNHLTDTDKMQLVGMMGQSSPDGGAGFGSTGEWHFIPNNVVLNPEFPGSLESWDRAVQAGIFEKRTTGYLVPEELLVITAEVTGMKPDHLKRLYQSVDPANKENPAWTR